jgi:hypothetical protein
MGHPELVDHLVQVEVLVARAHLDQVVQVDQADPVVLMVYQVVKVILAQVAHLVQVEVQAPQDQVVQVDLVVHQDHPDQVVLMAYQEAKVTQDHQELVEVQVAQDHQEPVEVQVAQDHQEPVGHQEPMG